MRSPAQAIAWEICSKNRRTLFIAFGLIPLCALLGYIVPAGQELVNLVLAFSALFTFVSLIWVTSYTANDSRGRFAGFPSWMYTLPLRTSILVGCPMLLGAVLVGVAASFWEVIICHYSNIRVEPKTLCWHGLLAVGTLISVQALVWSLHRFRWIRIVALVLVIYAFLYVGLVGRMWNFPGGAYYWFGGVALATAVAAMGGVAGVERDRRGEWVGWTGKWLERLLDLAPRRESPFQSPAHAQFWFEWRRKGFWMSTFFAAPMALTLVLLPLPAALYLDPVQAMMNFSIPLIGLIVIAGAIGGSVAKSDAWSTELRIHPMVATKPQSDIALVLAKMKCAAGITGMAWVLFCLLSVPVIAWCNQADWPNEQGRRFWPDFATNFPKLWEWLTNPVVILGILVVTWHTMVQAMAVSLTGNKRRVIWTTWKGIVVFAVMSAAAVWFYKEPNHATVVAFFRLLPLVSLALLGRKLFGAIDAMVAARRLVSGRAFLLLLGLWGAVAVLVMAAAFLANATPGAPTAIVWFLVALQYFPGGEIPACVVALASNRHRAATD